ncbi:RNA helicase, partial [Streptomyces sp. NPDC059810]
LDVGGGRRAPRGGRPAPAGGRRTSWIRPPRRTGGGSGGGSAGGGAGDPGTGSGRLTGTGSDGSPDANAYDGNF